MRDSTSTPKLIKGKLSRANKKPWTRFVELESYKAWAYIMKSRHRFAVSAPARHVLAEAGE